MTSQMTDDEARARINELEALLNGLMIYIAAKEAGVELDTRNKAHAEFFKTNVARTNEHMLETGRSTPEAGYHDSRVLAKVRDYREQIEKLK